MRPSVSILMALYKPKKEWLIEQLQSLNCQSYDNLELLIWNDCPEDDFDYENFIGKYIIKFPYKIYRGTANLGSNKVFELLTNMAHSDYIAYCDQDDIWCFDKIEVLVDKIQKHNYKVVCSDMYVIDEKGSIQANKISEVRRNQIFVEGEGQLEYLFQKNFVTGCTVLANTAFARMVTPFSSEYYHDWWLALYASKESALGIVKKPLIKYRIHSMNQTGILGGITNKKSYFEKRIMLANKRSIEVMRRFGKNSLTKRFNQYTEVRKQYFIKPKFVNAMSLWEWRKYNYLTTLFELAIPLIPGFLFSRIISWIRKV